MNIGFHYHIPVMRYADGRLGAQSFYGLFIDSIASQCDHLVVFAYSPAPHEVPSVNYTLRSTNITLVDLGVHDSLPKRLLRFPRVLKILKDHTSSMDVLLVRSPTPLVLLLPFLPKKAPIVLYLVGSYVEGAKNLSFNFLKNALIRLLAYQVEKTQRKLARNKVLLANSQVLVDEYKNIAGTVHLVKTTTLSEDDFYARNNNGIAGSLKILYTGRIEEAKGLLEILAACELLATQGMPVEFHFAGLLVKGRESFPEALLEKSRGSVMEGKVFYHGLKRVGDELNQLYRSCDIYVVASRSHFEGFPRTIWEAMANSLPVIASPMGSIPHFLKNGQDALLLDSITPDNIAAKIKYLAENDKIREQLIHNGLRLARENTLENQARKVIGVLKTTLS